MNENRTKRVSIWAHPAVVVILSVAGIVSAIYVLAGATPRDLSVALLIGLGTGLPTILIVKWVLRRSRDFYAEFYTPPFKLRMSWRGQGFNWLYGSPILLGILGAFWLEAYLHAPRMSGVSIIWALSILLYPEQKAIYETAKARLREPDP